MSGLSRQIIKQLRACQLRPGIWAGCPPEKVSFHSDPDLYVMVHNGLVQWLNVKRGYVLTESGESALMPHLWLIRA